MYETAYEDLRNICHAWKKGLKDLGGKELAPPGIHPDKFTPFAVPYCLTQVKGGVTVWDLVNNIFETIARFVKVENSAFTNVKHYFSSQSTLPTPPPYFKLGTVLYVNDNEIHIKMSIKLPIGNCGDGVSIN